MVRLGLDPAPWCWNIYLQIYPILMEPQCRYSSTMEHLAIWFMVAKSFGQSIRRLTKKIYKYMEYGYGTLWNPTVAYILWSSLNWIPETGVAIPQSGSIWLNLIQPVPLEHAGICAQSETKVD